MSKNAGTKHKPVAPSSELIAITPATSSTLQEDKTQAWSPVKDDGPRKQAEIIQADKSQYIEKVVINQEKFDKRYGYKRINLSLGRKLAYHFRKVKRWNRLEWLEFLRECVPILKWLPYYRRDWIVTDVLGGLMVSILSVPQGLAYGYLSGVPPIYGLYTSIYLSIVYVVFGSSRHTAPGAFAIISMMVGTVVEEVSSKTAGGAIQAASIEQLDGLCCSPHSGNEGNEADKIDIATSVTLLVGIWQILFGLMNAGIFAVWLSEYLVKGLMGGAAIHVLTSQIKSMTGLKYLPGTSSPFGLISFYGCLFKQAGDIDPYVLILSVVSIALLLISSYILDPITKKWCATFKFPMELLLVVYGTVGMTLLKKTRWTVEDRIPVVGEVSFGLVAPSIPSMNNFGLLISHSISIAIISFAIHIALAKLIAKQMQYTVNSNQEWFALGWMHLFASFFGCFAGGSSLGRSLMQVKFGTHTQMSTLTAAVVLIAVVFGASALITELPKAILAAIVVVALKDLILTIFRNIKLYHVSVVDFLIYYITFFAVVIVNVNYGLIIGISFALMTVIFRSQWPESTCVGRIPGTSDFKGFGQYREVEDIIGMRVFRFDAPIYFGNAELFLHSLYQAVGVDPVKEYAEFLRRETQAQKRAKARDKEYADRGEGVEERQQLISLKEDDEEKHGDEDLVEMQLTHVIVDCSAIPYVDLMGKDVMVQASEEYNRLGITVFYSHCKVGVRQFLENTDFHKKVPKSRLFVKISDAIEQAVIEQTKEPESERRDNVFTKDKRLLEDKTQREDPSPQIPTIKANVINPKPMQEQKPAQNKKEVPTKKEVQKKKEVVIKKDVQNKKEVSTSKEGQNKNSANLNAKKKDYIITVPIKKPEDKAPPVRRRETKPSVKVPDVRKPSLKTDIAKKKKEQEKVQLSEETAISSVHPGEYDEDNTEIPTDKTQPLNDKSGKHF